MEEIKKNKEPSMVDVEMRKLDMKEKSRQSFLTFYRINKGKVNSLVISFLTLVCLFNFGFFKTLGIWVVMLIGFFIGAYFDRDVRVLQIIRKILN
ncbi:DUF2273 domain-containing protein [Anaerococcus degeneri]|uniref:DUF2273 domain-containing protein n=1 Tax=Anaerococcus degeneri TaxID=361500 RepID=A0ABS7YYG1_9FIRM|nr:DUF2273 domain-containing protein [Anaerococcus degeneri]MBP2016393.1 putative membrane protein [Anaerococcus degeneri]MCA2096759.1 DUF2273 domain-containing protein [Anaerococcus degeneri]